MEPVALPARFPNLLVNGSVGIAVGMATSIPPHNMGEVIDGVIMLLDNQDATVEDLMEVIKGPDFPTGGAILGHNGIRDAFRTGRGRIVVRAHADIEEMRNGRQRIIVNDLPYMVNKARLIERMAELVKDKKIEGVSDVRDESDRTAAVRIVIELKKDSNANVVLNQLYKHSSLQEAFNANMLALVPDENGALEPKTINLMDALTHYIRHQEDVIRRRTKFDLERAEARKHIVEGLLKAIDHIDEVISIIRSSRTEDEAKKRLSERFDFTERQAQHIVDMRLGRLTGLEREKLQKELRDLEERIEYFTSILGDEDLLHKVIKEEITVVKNKFSNPRRTEITVDMDEEIDDESLIQEEEVIVTLTHFGYVKRLSIDTYKSQHRGGRGISGLATREEDFVETLLTTSTHDTLLFFTNLGRVFRLKGYQIPDGSRQARGLAIVNLLHLDGGEKVQTVIPIHSFEDGGYLMMATQNGIVKKTELSDYARINKSGLIAVNLRDEDKLIGVRLTDGTNEIVLVTRKGLSIRFSEANVRDTGRNTMGVRGINLSPEDAVIGMAPVIEGANLLVVSEKGFGKRTEMEEYRIQTRGGKGLMTYRIAEKTGVLVGIALVDDEKDVLLINDAGIVIRLAAAEIPVLSRVTQGVTLMRSRDGKVVDIAILEHEEYDEQEDSSDVIGEEVTENTLEISNEEAPENT